MNVALVRETYVEFVHITITYGFLHEDIWTIEKATFHSRADADSFIYELSIEKTRKLIHVESKITIFEEQVPAE